MLWPARMEACWLFLVHHFLSSAFALICIDVYLVSSLFPLNCVSIMCRPEVSAALKAGPRHEDETVRVSCQGFKAHLTGFLGNSCSYVAGVFEPKDHQLCRLTCLHHFHSMQGQRLASFVDWLLKRTKGIFCKWTCLLRIQVQLPHDTALTDEALLSSLGRSIVLALKT